MGNQRAPYHVDRSRFDLLLLKHAESLGSKVYQGVRVKEVLMEDGAAVGVRVDIAGQSVELRSRIVVDATGRNTLLGRQLKLKEGDQHFNQFAVHGWFDGVDRGDDDSRDEIHIHFLPVERGWVWQIPITDAITSMGVVAERRVFKAGKRDHEGWFYDLIASAPDIAHAMRDATRIDDFKIEADYSYCLKSFCGSGFLIVGDAARFVDPIFSSGVSVALSSAKFASQQIQHAFAAKDFSEAALKPYEKRLRRGTTIWYEFITLYYKLLPLFTKFIQSKKHRHQVLELLQGEVYDREEVPVLDAMREYIFQVENTEGHLLQPALDPTLPMPKVASDPAPSLRVRE